LRCLLQSSTG